MNLSRQLQYLVIVVGIMGVGSVVLPVCKGQTLPPGSSDKKAGDAKLQRIEVGDRVAVSVARQPGFSAKCIVRADGKITLPLVDEVRVAGLTATEVQELLTQKLGFFLTSPRVTVVVQARSGAFVPPSLRHLKPGGGPWLLPDVWPRS